MYKVYDCKRIQTNLTENVDIVRFSKRAQVEIMQQLGLSALQIERMTKRHPAWLVRIG